jgi:hydrogenase maturation protease
MSTLRQTGTSIVVACVGSPHGDDQAAWRLAEMLHEHADETTRVITVYDPTEIVDQLQGCRKLIVIDACRSGGEVGHVTRLRWPNRRIVQRHSRSTHGIGVSQALRLAERLGRLPLVVEIFGIEVADCFPGNEISLAVMQAVVDLEKVISYESREVLHA